MGIKSINEPDGPGRTTMIAPFSINEPPAFTGEKVSAPTITALSPDTCTLGDPSFTMYVSGENFSAASVITFAGYDEPTTMNDEGTVSTIINMDVWNGPDTVKVSVRNGDKVSNELPFTFEALTLDSAAAAASGTKRKPRR